MVRRIHFVDDKDDKQQTNFRDDIDNLHVEQYHNDNCDNNTMNNKDNAGALDEEDLESSVGALKNVAWTIRFSHKHAKKCACFGQVES